MRQLLNCSCCVFKTAMASTANIFCGDGRSPQGNIPIMTSWGRVSMTRKVTANWE